MLRPSISAFLKVAQIFEFVSVNDVTMVVNSSTDCRYPNLSSLSQDWLKFQVHCDRFDIAQSPASQDL